MSDEQQAERRSGPVDLQQGCSADVCEGTRDGAAFDIQLPDTWNGTLLLWSHGYRATEPVPADPTSPDGAVRQPNHDAESAPSPEVAQDLLDQGYALAGSANATNGWAVQDSVTANEDLYSYFVDTFGRPNRVYAWGGSLGGLSTQVLAETHPSWLSGSAALCAPLAGTNLNLDLALDVAYSVKTLFDPSLRLTGFSSNDEAVRQWEHASSALVDAASRGRPKDVAGLLTIQAITGAPDRTQDQDGSTPTSTGTAIVEAIINALGYATFARYELEQRVGGNPSDNTDADYGARLSGADRDLIDTAAPGQLAGVLRKLARGDRVSADDAAREAADELGTTTGDITTPTMTMHTIADPLVLAANETVYAERVDAADDSAGLSSLLTEPPTTYSTAPYGAGHCNFTREETLGVVALLDRWVRHGVYPAQGAVEAQFDYSTDPGAGGRNNPESVADGTATSGYSPSLLPPPWPDPDAAVLPTSTD